MPRRSWLIFAVLVALAHPAEAIQSAPALFRAYLSSTGSDTNPCTLQAPCRLLPAALDAVQSGGEVWMLDSANYNTSTVFITKSVNVLAIPGAVGSFVSTGGPALVVSTAGLAVSLRNVVLVPLATDTSPFDRFGLVVTAASTVSLEECVIARLQRGVVASGGNARASISSCVIRDVTQYAVLASDGGAISVSRSVLKNNSSGVAAVSSVQGITQTSTSDSVIEGGSYAVTAQTGASGATARNGITRSTISGCINGLWADNTGVAGGGPVISISTSTVTQCSSPTVILGGQIKSGGDNHFLDNASPASGMTVIATQ